MMTVPPVVDASTGKVLPTSWVEEEELSLSDKFGRYIVALYWAMYTFLTVGYGDITIVNTAEKIWAIITAITGVVMAGWFMGAVGTFMGGTGGREADILQRRQDVFLFIQKRHLRGRLASRLQHYQDSIMWRELTDSDRDIINGLPRMLRTELVLHLYDKVVQKVLFMQTRPPQLVVELLLRLRLQLYEKDEYVVREGEIGSEIFFLAQGEVEVRRESPDEDEEDSGTEPSNSSIRSRNSSRFRVFLLSITRRLGRSSNGNNPQYGSLSVRDIGAGPGCSIGTRPSSGLGRLSRGVDGTSAAAPYGTAAAAAAAAAPAADAAVATAGSPVQKDSLLVSKTLADAVRGGDRSFGGRDLLTQLVEDGTQEQQQRRRRRQGAAAATAAGGNAAKKGGGRGSSVTRKYKSLGYIKAGGLFGHVSCMGGEVRRNSVVAVVRSEVLVLSREDAEELGKDWPDIYNDRSMRLDKLRRRSACLNDTLSDSVEHYVPHPGGPVPCGSRHRGRAAGVAGEAGLGSSLRRKSRPHGGGGPWCAQPATLGRVPEKQAVRMHRMDLVAGSGQVLEDLEHNSDENEGEGGPNGEEEAPGSGDVTVNPDTSTPEMGPVVAAPDRSGRTDVSAGQSQVSVSLTRQVQPPPPQQQQLLVQQGLAQE
ncbi:hypothetical protein Vretimale_8336 [Volvox reticuliferus]|nr:hypothetical protein Vretifemale_11711 [Volvox reticuliferus]GIM03608.1 hypothetical protein Vretimale_8336 [Volvox reticuliferus]